MNISNVKMDEGNQSGANSSGSNNSNNSSKNRCNLIINYLPQSLKEHDFNLLFSKIGPLKTCKLMFDRQTGYSFGYGFVEYLNEDDARKAIDTLNGYQIEHKRLKVALARPNCDETKNTNLYIRNIPINYDEQQLHDLFSQYGEVVQVRILRDQNTTFSRRIGFIIMSTKQMAQTAIQNLDNTVPPNGASEPIFVKYADEEGKKRHGPPGAVGNARGSGPGGNQMNQHQGNFQNSNNYMNQQNSHGFNFNNPNSFMMNNQNSMNALSNNSLQNLGKMKTNRSGGHQNRYNPMGGGALNNQGGLNNNNNSNNGANNYNPWNMAAAAAAAAIQQPYSNFGTQNPLIGNSGFDSLINTIGGVSGGGSGGGGYNNHHGNMQHGHMQQHYNNSSNANNYLNLNSAQAAAAAMAAAAAAAAAGLGNSSSSGNLLDISGNAGISGSITGMSGSASLPIDGKQSSNSSGHIIYVYGIGQANESDLYSLFSHCGRILRVNVIKNQKTGQCKGYGFVVFETYDEAYYAVHNMNGYMYNHRPLQVQLNSGNLD